MNAQDAISKSYYPHIIRTKVDSELGILAVLSDIHEGANNRSYLQNTVKFLVGLGENCKVVIGGDCTNTITRTSKGVTPDEWASGDEQIFSLVEDIRPLYDSGQLIGILSGNHTRRAYDSAYITIEAMIASILGDRSLYKGVMGIVYFNVKENCYVHHIVHKHRTTEGAYDYFSADVNWFEHRHKPMARPKIMIEHNKFAKVPVARMGWDIYQSSFQDYPDYAKAGGHRPSPMGFYLCEMSGDKHNRYTNPYLDSQYREMIKGGYLT